MNDFTWPNGFTYRIHYLNAVTVITMWYWHELGTTPAPLPSIWLSYSDE